MKAVVVGGGIMGLSSAWALRRRGWEVTVLEQGPLPNPLGSSVDQHRLIRKAYGGSVGYTRMIGEAFLAWELLWGDLGSCLYHRTGTLALASGEAGWAQDSRATLSTLDIDHAVLGQSELQQRFPYLRFDDIDWGLWLDSGGALLAQDIVEALAVHLRDQGVDLRTETQVVAVAPDRAAATTATGDCIEGDVLVVACGPWSPRLLPSLAGRVTPSRQVVAYARPPTRWAEAWAGAPMILDVGKAGFYSVPPVAGTGLKIGDHSFSLRGNPDEDRQASATEAEAVYALAEPRFSDWADFELVSSRTCFYSVEPDEAFLLEQVGQAWVLAGFSGHGFKFGALMGLAVAQGIAGERDGSELSSWAAGRGA